MASLAKLISTAKKGLKYKKAVSGAKRAGKKRRADFLKQKRLDKLAQFDGTREAGENYAKVAGKVVARKVADVVKNPKKAAKNLKKEYDKTGGIKNVLTQTLSPGYKKLRKGTPAKKVSLPRDQTIGHAKGSRFHHPMESWSTKGPDETLDRQLFNRGEGYVRTPDPASDVRGESTGAVVEINTHSSGKPMLDFHQAVAGLERAGIEDKAKLVKGKLKKAIAKGNKKKIKKHTERLTEIEEGLAEIDNQESIIKSHIGQVRRHERTHAKDLEDSVYNMVARMHPKERAMIVNSWKSKWGDAIADGDRRAADAYERAIDAVYDMDGGSLAETIRAHGLQGIPIHLRATNTALGQATGARSRLLDIEKTLDRIPKREHDAYEDLVDSLTRITTEVGARANEGKHDIRGPFKGLRSIRRGFLQQTSDPVRTVYTRTPADDFMYKVLTPAHYGVKYAPHAGVGGAGYLGYKLLEDD
tara:strand:- start:1055 stop:2470 length:1416 start_codon:yes stop_codon:yes gene_type:complete